MGRWKETPAAEQHICFECKKAFTSKKSLHGHLRAHKMSMGQYYQKYFPRYDKFSNQLIRFKNLEQYFETDFNNKDNLRKWLLTQKIDVAQEYCKNWLLDRKKKKNLTWAPSHIELRSLYAPSVVYFNKLFGSYYELCKELGFKVRFEDFDNDSFIVREYPNDAKIYIDTREQKPLQFKDLPDEKHTLKFGDYACTREDFCGKFRVERKALGDLIGTLTGDNLDRFKREIERAKEQGYQLVVLVEESFEHASGFKALPHIYQKCKVTPDYILHKARELCQEYSETVQFVFVEGRKEASRIIEKLFRLKGAALKYELQVAVDLRVI